MAALGMYRIEMGQLDPYIQAGLSFYSSKARYGRDWPETAMKL